MRIQIESTEDVVEFDGVETRKWRGVTETGVECFVFVHRLAVSNDLDQSRFEAELQQKDVPGRVTFHPAPGSYLVRPWRQ